MEMIDRLGPMLPGYDTIWTRGRNRDYCERQFRYIYDQLRPCMGR